MSILTNLNYIRKVYTIPCVGAGLWVYIETAITSAGIALLELASFGCRDLYQLRGGKLPFCGRQISPNFKKAWLAEDITKYSKIIKVFDPIEKALFKWLLVDIGVGFVANWHSMLFQTANCNPDANVFHAAADHGSGAGIAPNINFRIAYNKVGGNTNPAQFYGYGFQVPRGWYWSCDFNLRVKKLLNFPIPSIELWLNAIPGGSNPERNCKYDPTVWFGPQYASCHREGQAPLETAYTNYEFYGRMDGWGLPSGGSMTLRMSALPLLDTPQSVLSCLKYQVSFLPGVEAVNQEVPVPFLPTDEHVNAATGILLSKAGLKK